jgi:hypothetical protein
LFIAAAAGDSGSAQVAHVGDVEPESGQPVLEVGLSAVRRVQVEREESQRMFGDHLSAYDRAGWQARLVRTMLSV